MKYAFLKLAIIVYCAIFMGNYYAFSYQQSPFLDERTTKGTLPSVEKRLPHNPKIVSDNLSIGRYGGTIRTLMRKEKDIRQMVVYGYARLVRYNKDYQIEADILEKYEVIEGKKFIFHLRENHRWSDGKLFTSEDFLFWWNDIAQNNELYPAGPPAKLKVNGELPRVYADGKHKIIYEWTSPNPSFLGELAKASPLYIYAHKDYLKNYHIAYQNTQKLEQLVQQHKRKNWASLFNKLNKPYKNGNINLPSLQPYQIKTSPPSSLYVFERNPYFHRVDRDKNQLPYIDRWEFYITERKLISLKASTGEVDLQARNLSFSDISLLKKNEEKYKHRTFLWSNGRASHLSFYPNLNYKGKSFRTLVRNKKFRQALSYAINRYEINRVLYFGLAKESQNTLQSPSPLAKEAYRTSHTEFNIEKANKILNELGLAKRDSRGVRLMDNGKPLDIIVEVAGAGDLVDVLTLTADHWQEIGIKLHTKPTSLEVLRKRVFAGDSQMVLSGGSDNGIASFETVPEDFAPVKQVQYQWPKWGQYYETKTASGEEIDDGAAKKLLHYYHEWFHAKSDVHKKIIWDKMLKIHADELFTIGIVAQTLQPVLVGEKLQNIPEKGVWNWDPGAHFGIYEIDRFWFKE